MPSPEQILIPETEAGVDDSITGPDASLMSNEARKRLAGLVDVLGYLPVAEIEIQPLRGERPGTEELVDLPGIKALEGIEDPVEIADSRKDSSPLSKYHGDT